MISDAGILIVSLGWALFVAYQVLRYKRTYWVYPTISGFKDRKNPESPRIIAYFLGIPSLVFAALFLYVAVRWVVQTLKP